MIAPAAAIIFALALLLPLAAHAENIQYGPPGAGGASPIGAAGGGLNGTYPNPGLNFGSTAGTALQGGVTIQLNPSGVWSGAGNNGNGALFMNNSWSGTATSAGTNSIALLQATDTVASSGTFEVLAVNDILNSSAVTGLRHTGEFDLTLNAATGDTTPPGQTYTALNTKAIINSANSGGSGTENGLIYATNNVTQSNSSASFYKSVMTQENDLNWLGASPYILGNTQFVDTGSTVQGTFDDFGISLNAGYTQTAGRGRLYGLVFGRNGAFFPVASTGTLIGALTQSGTMTVAHGIDLHLLTCTVDCLKLPGGVSIDGSGNFATSGTIAGTVTAASLPVPSTFHAPYTICQSGSASSVTGTATETNLAACKIPANTLGANGVIRVTTLWNYTNSANNKTIIVRLGTSSGAITGTQFLGTVVTTTATFSNILMIRNANATGSQTAFPVATNPFTTSTSALTTSSTSTTADTYININGTLANTGETITLAGYTVEVLVP